MSEEDKKKNTEEVAEAPAEQQPVDDLPRTEDGKVDIDRLEVSILFIVKNKNMFNSVKKFLERRGWPVFFASQMNEAIKIITSEKPEIVMISFNHTNPKIIKLPNLLVQTFNTICVGFCESPDIRTENKLGMSKLAHKLIGPASGPSIHRRIKQILAEIHGVVEEKQDRSLKGKKSKASQSNMIQIKSNGKGEDSKWGKGKYNKSENEENRANESHGSGYKMFTREDDDKKSGKYGLNDSKRTFENEKQESHFGVSPENKESKTEQQKMMERLEAALDETKPEHQDFTEDGSPSSITQEGIESKDPGLIMEENAGSSEANSINQEGAKELASSVNGKKKSLEENGTEKSEKEERDVEKSDWEKGKKENKVEEIKESLLEKKIDETFSEEGEEENKLKTSGGELTRKKAKKLFDCVKKALLYMNLPGKEETKNTTVVTNKFAVFKIITDGSFLVMACDDNEALTSDSLNDFVKYFNLAAEDYGLDYKIESEDLFLLEERDFLEISNEHSQAFIVQNINKNVVAVSYFNRLNSGSELELDKSGKYFQISPRELKADMEVNFQSVIHLEKNEKYISYTKAGRSITRRQIERLSKSNIILLVSKSQKDKLDHYFLIDSILGILGRKKPEKKGA